MLTSFALPFHFFQFNVGHILDIDEFHDDGVLNKRDFENFMLKKFNLVRCLLEFHFGHFVLVLMNYTGVTNNVHVHEEVLIFFVTISD